jgi:hypothetical protein
VNQEVRTTGAWNVVTDQAGAWNVPQPKLPHDQHDASLTPNPSPGRKLAVRISGFAAADWAS